MKLGDIYSFFVREGINADPRGRKVVERRLADVRKAFRKLSVFKKKFFDKEALHNPYSDTRMLFGAVDTDVKRILVGIDIDASELLLVDRLRQRGERIDLVISHHPRGVALAGLAEVMPLQTDLLRMRGIPTEVAKELMGKRIDKVARSLHGANIFRAVDVARLLDIPFMCCHTAADNHVVKYLQLAIDNRKPRTLKNLLDGLVKEPEFRQAERNKLGPQILVGSPKDLVGEVFVDMTGGAEGSNEVFARLSQAGVDTLLCMHISEPHFLKVSSEYLNVVNAGHMASDSLGMNLLLDKLQKRAAIDVVECSGFRRVKR